MQDTQITDAIVSFQDEGTGAPSGHHDPNSAAMISGALLGLDQFVATGLRFKPSYTDDTLTITPGVAYLRFSGNISVQPEPRADYTETWNGPVVFPVSFGEQTGIPLDANAVNDVYLWLDETADDEAYIRTGASASGPSTGSLKLGEVDTSAETHTEVNRVPDVTGWEGRLEDRQDPVKHDNSQHLNNYSEQGHDHTGEHITPESVSLDRFVDLAPMSEPSAPSEGYRVFTDSSDGSLKAKHADGTVTDIIS